MAWTLWFVMALAGAALAQEKPCTIHDDDNKFYDLNPLRGSKDYEVETASGHTAFLNLCGGVRTETWNTKLDESQANIAGIVRMDRGDFAIGLVNTTLELKDGGLLLHQSQGSPCEDIDEQGSSSILFICDTSVYSAGKPVFLGHWPEEEDRACHYQFEWRTHYACPTGERGFLGGLFVFLTISFLILLMVFIVISTVYNRFVLRLRGFEQLPKFTVAHAREIWDVCAEFFSALVDFIVAAWHTRTRRRVNPASHHWASRDEEVLRETDPLEELEDVRDPPGV